MADGATVAAQILAQAKFLNGGHYVANAEDPSIGFDCSSFVQYLYGKAGISLPRRTWDQVNTGINIDANNAAPGDLVFFDETGTDAPGPGGSPWGHVGIYLGNGQMIDAANPQAGIRIESIAGFSPVGRFVFRRVIPNYAGTGDTGVTTPGLSSSLLGDPSAAASPQWDSSSIASALGLSGALFDSNPELKSVLDQATAEGLDPSTEIGKARFTALLQNTNWYKSKTDAQRKWELLGTSDPAEARQQFVSSLANIAHTAAALGVTLSTQQEWVLASQAAQFNLTSDEVKFSIASHLQTNKTGFYNGQAGQVADTLRQTAQSFGQPMSAIDVGKATFQILNGHATQEDFTNNAKQYAISMFPGASAAIQGGKTLSDVAQPYLQTYQSVLEQNPQSVDLAKDPTIRQALAYQAPGSTPGAGTTGGTTNSKGTPDAGALAPSTQPLWQFEQSLKNDPRWLGTDNAQQALSGAGATVLKQLGLSS